jgi:hypothetical protein
MTNRIPISQAEDEIESFALLISRYYDSLVRGNVPAETAERLALAYQQQILQHAVGRQALAQFGTWLAAQQKRRTAR